MFEKTTTGEWVVIILSLIYAFFATLSRPINESGSFLAGTFIGSFIVLLIILYAIYWIITKIFPNSENWGLILWIIALIGIPILIVIVLAIIIAFIFGMAGTSTSTNQTTEQITYQTIVAPTIVSKSTVINFYGNNGWVKYTNYDDKFSIFTPSDWAVVALDKTDKVFNFDSSLQSQMMNKVVGIYTPNLKGFIMIYGVDYSGTLASIFNDPGKTQISDELYDGFIQGIKTGETDDVKITSVEKDSNYYMINGNPARRLVLHWQINGEPLSGDAYIIAHENAYYVEIYSAMVGSSQSDASTASEIMRTFTTTI